MGLFNIVADIITLPLAIAKDVITLGGTMTDNDEPYTVEKIKRIDENIEKACKGD